jgi:hypothetical protein
MVTRCTGFAATKRIASGDLPMVAREAKAVWDRDKWAQVLIFDDVTSNLIEVDFRGSPEDVVGRIAEEVPDPAPGSGSDKPDGDPRRPGRPRLGVVGREVTLLPQHWDWLANQPGGASVALRKLVEQARTANSGRDRRRRAQEAAYKFLSAMAGNELGFEEAIRALFGGKRERFDEMVEAWPEDVRDHAKKLGALAFAE